MQLLATVALWSIAGGAAAGGAPDLPRVRALQSQGQWAAAESLAAGALTALESAPAADSLAIAEACVLRGTAHMRRSGYADGRALADGARALGIRRRRLGPQHPAVAEAELLVGRAFQGAGRGDSALVHVRRGVDVREAALAPDDTLLAEAWDQLALLRRDRREYRPALDAWDKAIAARRLHEGGDAPAVALMQAQTGACWMELGDFATARLVLEGSLATFARLGEREHPSRWVPLNILSDLENREGNTARTVDLLEEALRLVNRSFGPGSRQALTLRVNLAARLLDLADYAGAGELLEAAYPVTRAQFGPAHERTCSILQGLGVTRSARGDVPGAVRSLSLAESLLALPDNPARAGLPRVLTQHALLFAEHGLPQEALALCDRADSAASLEDAGRNSRPMSTELVRIPALVVLGERTALEQVRRDLERRVALAGPLRPSLAAQLAEGEALADAALGRRDSAWAEALEAERVSRGDDRLNLQLLSDRRSLQYTRRDHRYLDLVFDLARGDEARTAVAWDRLVRARGLVRSELARRTVPRAFAGDTALTGAQARWRAAQERVARVLVRRAVADSAGRAALERAQAEAEVCERAFARALAGHGAGPVPGEAGLADVRARLSPGEALLAFDVTYPARDSARVCALLARAGVERLVRLELGPAATLRALIARWRASLATPPGTDPRDAGRLERDARVLGERVREKVWEPLAARLAGVRELYVVGDGPLEDLPWGALPEGKGYLVEGALLVHPVDCERALLDATPAGGAGRLLAVGAPDFDRAESAIPDTRLAASIVRAAPDPCAAGALTPLAPLPGSAAEAESVVAAWRTAGAGPATLLEGAAAAEPTFKHEAPGCAVIHMATHGVVRADRCAQDAPGTRGMGGVSDVTSPPARAPHAGAAAIAPPPAESSPWLARRVLLALAGANRSGEHVDDDDEGLLTAEEVSTLDLDGTDWVVLSACHSGAGSEWSGDGQLSMRRAFGLAGARSVISSSWALDDRATGEWMRALYGARLRGHADAATAIRDASRKVLAARRASGRPTHPFYWAAFGTGGR